MGSMVVVVEVEYKERSDPFERAVVIIEEACLILLPR